MMYLLCMACLVMFVYPVFTMGKWADRTQNETLPSLEEKQNFFE